MIQNQVKMKKEYVAPELTLVEGKQVKDFPAYTIYENGKLFSKFYNNFVGSLRPDGYIGTMLSNGDIKRYVPLHILVAEAFIPKPETTEKLEVNHKNQNRSDNRVENLEWLTHPQNVAYEPTRLSMKEAKRHIMKPIQCIETGKIFECLNDAAKDMHLNVGHIYNHLNHPKNIHSVKGYTFKFI